MFTLRPYQTSVIDEVRARMREGYRSIMLQCATGSGKTAMAVSMLGTAQAKGQTGLFTVHRRELVRQSMDMFETVGVPFGVIAAQVDVDPRVYKHYRPDARIQIAAIQTLGRRYTKLAPPNLIVPDEAHHSTAASWSKILGHFKKAFIVGLSATPERLDGSGLDAHFQVMVCGPTISWLIEQGFLAPYALYAPPGISTAGIKTEMGDYNKTALAAAADRPTITGDIIKHYLMFARGKRALGFAVNIEHSKHLVQGFNQHGIPAAHVDGETAPHIRDGIFEDYRLGKLLVVFNVDLAGEGFDVPATEAVILARPTQSLAMYLQQVGRAMRPAPGKTEAIILDHAGNCRVHGLPDKDLAGNDRTWTLAGNKRGKAKGPVEAGVKTCSQCFRVQAFAPKCRFCGAEFPVAEGGRKVEEVDGTLERVGQVVTFDGPPVKTKREMTEAQLWAMFRSKGVQDVRLAVAKVMAARDRRAQVLEYAKDKGLML